jgi:di/tricarboxylate transporter
METRLFAWNLFAHALLAFGGYFLLGGWRLFRQGTERHPEAVPVLERRHWLTLLVMAMLVTAAVAARVHVGLAAFAASTLLALLGAASIEDGIRKCPWGVLLMVCGVTVLIALIERNGAMELFTGLLARFSTRDSVTAVMAFLTGLISTYSSTSGVILPAFLPTVPQLAQRLGANPEAIALSIGVGAHLVDVSPLSTIGALCIASLPPSEDSRALFNRLLAWGLSMTVAGPVVCWLFFR